MSDLEPAQTEVIDIDVDTGVTVTHDAEAGCVRPDPRQIAAHAKIVSHLLQAHGGGIEVIPGGEPDVVRLRFTGLCTACSLRPLTVANIVKPILGDVEGVNEVEVEGCRISSEAMARLAS